ncbi:leucine-rich repeat protein [Tanacetum coccineum]
MLSSWVGNDCCKWERVHCDKVTGKVDSLHLRGRYDGIEYLIGNDFRGSRIPEFIGSFKQLSYLNLSNAFSGIIPPRIGNLSNLVVLDLKTITDPEPSLKSLDLSFVNLSKAQNRDMVFYMMPSLVKLKHDIPGIPGPFKLQFPAFFAKHDWFFSKAEFVKLWAP